MTAQALKYLRIFLYCLPALWWVDGVRPLLGADQPPAETQAISWQDTVRRATDQVLASSASSSPFLRANTLEACEYLPDRAVPMIQLSLQDAHPAVRFAGLATMGKLRRKELVPAATRLLNDPSESVQAAALFALRQCGEPIDISPLAAMLASQNPSLRGNVAMLLGMMGDGSATPMLKDLARVPMPRASAVQETIVRIQIAEAIAKLGDDSALNALRSGAYSQFDEVRVLAVSMMGQLGDRRMEKALLKMLAQPPIELQIAAAGSLAQMGHVDGLDVVLGACQSPLATVRAQAAITLGFFPDDKARAGIVNLLNDADEQARLSAAAAILRLAQRPGSPDRPVNQ